MLGMLLPLILLSPTCWSSWFPATLEDSKILPAPRERRAAGTAGPGRAAYSCPHFQALQSEPVWPFLIPAVAGSIFTDHLSLPSHLRTSACCQLAPGLWHAPATGAAFGTGCSDVGGSRGTPQLPNGEEDALQTNLPQHARADLAVQLVATNAACPRAATAGRKRGKAFLTGIWAHKEQQQLLGNEK